MLTSTTHITRFGVIGSRALQLQSTLARGTSFSASLSQISSKAVRHIHISPKRAKPAYLQCQFVGRRLASSSAVPPSSTPALDWNTFFTLRKTRRRYQVACSFATMMVGATTAGLVLINIDMDWLGKLPLDPFITLGLMTMSSAALGWLAGPSFGSSIFHMVKRGVKAPMAVKEAEFFARIKKNRVDPSVSSAGNPGKLNLPL
jgi:import inner membrane translocase subunit TIM23